MNRKACPRFLYFSSLRFLYRFSHLSRKIHMSRKIQHVTHLVPLERICYFSSVVIPCKNLFSIFPLECYNSFREIVATQTFSITINSNMEVSEFFCDLKISLKIFVHRFLCCKFFNCEKRLIFGNLL